MEEAVWRTWMSVPEAANAGEAKRDSSAPAMPAAARSPPPKTAPVITLERRAAAWRDSSGSTRPWARASRPVSTSSSNEVAVATMASRWRSWLSSISAPMARGSTSTGRSSGSVRLDFSLPLMVFLLWVGW